METALPVAAEDRLSGGGRVRVWRAHDQHMEDLLRLLERQSGKWPERDLDSYKQNRQIGRHIYERGRANPLERTAKRVSSQIRFDHRRKANFLEREGTEPVAKKARKVQVSRLPRHVQREAFASFTDRQRKGQVRKHNREQKLTRSKDSK